MGTPMADDGEDKVLRKRYPTRPLPLLVAADEVIE
jgi:hypothetical protein